MFRINILHYSVLMIIESTTNNSWPANANVQEYYWKVAWKPANFNFYYLLFHVDYKNVLLVLINRLNLFCRLIAYFGQQISDLLSLEWCLHGKQNLSSTRTRVAIINYQTDIDTLGYYYIFMDYTNWNKITHTIFKQ